MVEVGFSWDLRLQLGVLSIRDRDLSNNGVFKQAVLSHLEPMNHGFGCEDGVYPRLATIVENMMIKPWV